MRFFQCDLCFVVRYDPFFSQPLKYSSRAQKEKERMEIGLCEYFKDNFVLILFYFILFFFRRLCVCLHLLSFRVVNKIVFDLV